jgi:hypothetical protein
MVDIVNRATGEMIATTTLDFANRQLDVHRSAEAAIAAQRVRDAVDHFVRSDELRTAKAAFKAEVEERERADQVRKFADGVLELKHRFDRWEAAERERVDVALRGLPDADDHLGRSVAQQEADAGELPVAPLPPPHGDNQEVELTIERGRDDQEGGAPHAPFEDYPILPPMNSPASFRLRLRMPMGSAARTT